MSKKPWKSVFFVVASALGCSPDDTAARNPGESPADARADSAPVIGTRHLTFTAVSEPGSESGGCVGVSEPIPAEEWISGWHTTLVFAHHVNLWFVAPPTSIKTFCDAVGTFAMNGPTFVFDSSRPDSVTRVPGGGAIRIPAGSRYAFDVHTLNTTTERGTSEIDVDLDLVPPAPIEVFSGALSAANFSVPASSEATLSWSCTIPPDVRVAWMTSHTHGFTRSLAVEADGVEIFRSTNWLDPPTHTFDPPLTAQSVTWKSDIFNTLPTTLSFGPSRDKNEMSNLYVMTLGAREWCIRD